MLGADRAQAPERSVGDGRQAHDLQPLSVHDRFVDRRRRRRHRQSARGHGTSLAHAGASRCAKGCGCRGRANTLTVAALHLTHILVVGAGAAGLMTARELARAGKRVTILEARERCGGRISPLPATEFGYPAEGGAEFVHGAAPVTRGLTREARLLLSPREGTRWSARTGAFDRDNPSLPHAPARAGLPPRDDPTPPRPRRRNASHRFPGELAAKALAKEVSYIRLVVHDHDAHTHAAASVRAGFGLRGSRSKFGELADLAIDGVRAAMLLGHDVVADREAKPGALTGRLGREERLEQLVLDLRDYAGAVVADADFDCIAEISCRYLQHRLKAGLIAPAAFGGGVETVAEQVETDPSDVLRDESDRGNAPPEIAFERDVEALILGAGTMVGEVQCFLDQAIEIHAATLATTGMLQHALDDAIRTTSMLDDLFEITGQHLDGFIDLGALVLVERGDR